MALGKQAKKTAAMKKKILWVAAISFLEEGYAATTLRKIAKEANVNIGSLMNIFKSKEDILCELVGFVLKNQFESAKKLIEGKTEDNVLFYAVETTLQLYMAEFHESVRELYGAAYTMPKSSELIRRSIAAELKKKFQADLPEYTYQDFYELEIASGGIIRGFMSVSCGGEFTMERKVRSFLRAALCIYGVPAEKIGETIAFVQQFDFEEAANDAIENMLELLEKHDI